MAGRPPFRPTDEQRKMVESLSGRGVPQDDICALVGITGKTLRRYFGKEIAIGVAKANANIAGALYTKAMGDGPGAVTAAIFWAKTRMGWKETVRVENTGEDGGPIKIQRIERVIVDPADTDSARLSPDSEAGEV